MQYQQNNKSLIEVAKLNKDYSIKHFHRVEKDYSLICRKQKFVIPKLLKRRVVEWYHNALCHRWETCAELSIAQHFYLKELHKTVHDVCSKCKACQYLDKNKKQYGNLSPKEAEGQSWDVVCEDLIGRYRFKPKDGGKKYQMTNENGKIIYLQAVIMIGWIEICTVSSAQTNLVINQVELKWLTWYPLPSKVIVDQGNESLVKLKIMIQADYGIKIKAITSRNPLANSIWERVHQTIGNIIRTLKVQAMLLNDKNPWDWILASTMFALCTIEHITKHHTQAQLAF